MGPLADSTTGRHTHTQLKRCCGTFGGGEGLLGHMLHQGQESFSPPQNTWVGQSIPVVVGGRNYALKK